MSPRRIDDEVYDGATAEAIAELCKDEKIKASIAETINCFAAYLKALTTRKPPKMPFLPYYTGLLFGVCIFTGLMWMAYHHILSSESTTVLVGALIAAWWGGQKSGRK